MRRVALADGADLALWREAARALLAEGVQPGDVQWQSGAQEDLFGASLPSVQHARGPRARADGQGAQPRPAPQFRVPRDFLDLAALVVAHADARRHGVLYRLLWRIAGGERALLAMATDDDVAWARQAAKAVSREKHKMKAFVRFREVADGQGSVFVAWFEPEHDVLPQVAPFFVRRFAGMRWSILTPARSAHWDGEALHLGEGARRADAPDGDVLEDLWRTYYASIFNPARLKVGAMVKEMPVRYWKNMPEAALIPGLVRDAGSRMQAMVEAAPTSPRRQYPVQETRVAARKRADRAAAARLEAHVGAREGDVAALARDEGSPRPALDTVHAAVSACRACPLWAPATQAVPGEGPADAAIMVVGEQPGDREDLAGRPFVGPAGQLFDRALAEVGIDRGTLYLTNAVKHFKFAPRGKRRLHVRADASEQAACRPWLAAELAAVRPRVVLCLGATAAQALLGRSFALMANRGTWQIARDGTRVLATVHPSWLLRLPEAEQAAAWALFLRDLATLREGPGP